MVGQVFSLFQIRSWSKARLLVGPALVFYYIDDVIEDDKVLSLGFLFAFADDVLLVSLSVCSLQTMLSIAEYSLLSLDLRIKVEKCCSIRVGARFDKTCATLTTANNSPISWREHMR